MNSLNVERFVIQSAWMLLIAHAILSSFFFASLPFLCFSRRIFVRSDMRTCRICGNFDRASFYRYRQSLRSIMIEEKFARLLIAGRNILVDVIIPTIYSYRLCMRRNTRFLRSNATSFMVENCNFTHCRPFSLICDAVEFFLSIQVAYANKLISNEEKKWYISQALLANID